MQQSRCGIRVRAKSLAAEGVAAAALLAMLSSVAGQSRADATVGSTLDQITVVATGVSTMSAASSGDVGQDALTAQPLLRPGARAGKRARPHCHAAFGRG